MEGENNWKQFRGTGLLVFVNSFLHIFGWAIVLQFDNDDESKIVAAYPARVPFRGFSEKVIDEAYGKLTDYLSKIYGER